VIAPLALTLILIAAEPAAPRELKVAALELGLNGLDPKLSGPLTDQLVKPFAPVRVVTPRDVAALLGLERQKELMGCTTSGECMAELGNALGVQGVLRGDIVKIGTVININARVIDPLGGKPLAQASEQIVKDEQLFDALTRVGLELRNQFMVSLGVTPPQAVVAEVQKPVNRGTRRWFPIPLVVGGASLVGGAALFALAGSTYQQLAHGTPMSILATEAPAIAETGKLYQTLSAVFITVGIAAVVAAVAVLVFGSRGDG
jgi:hypothetical protein